MRMHKVLIVDDELPVRIAIRKLGNWGKWHVDEILEAENGKDALTTLMEVHPSIVFVDMQMPVMSGSQFLERASRMTAGTASNSVPTSAFIVVSGYDDFQYARDALHFGAMDYLLKPVVPEELDAAIGRAMKKLYPTEDFSTPESDGKAGTMSAAEVIRLIHDTIDTRYTENLKIQDFADRYFFTREYLSRLFKTEYGTGIYEYLTSVRMKRAEELLADPSVSIADIAARVGFSDSNYFSKAFRTWSGMTPSEWRKSHSKPGSL